MLMVTLLTYYVGSCIMSNIFKLLAISFLIIGCKNGYQATKQNAYGVAERGISNHSMNVTRDIAGSADAATRGAKQLNGQ